MTPAQEYLSLLPGRYSPNFFCSEEWFEKAGWKVEFTQKEKPRRVSIGVVDEDHEPMLPTIARFENGLITLDSVPWEIGFAGNVSGDFWDYEFIYDPQSFDDLSGHQWRDVRKNLRWAEEDVGESLGLVPLPPKEGEMTELVQQWLPSDKSEIFDPEALLRYVFAGKCRLSLRGTRSFKLYGLLIWDENDVYVNFRYCLVAPGIRGLSDSARVLFYRYIKVYGKLVNDGGALGRSGLLRYKQRLNPKTVNRIYSWYRKED